MRLCVICNNEYEPYNIHQKYCSTKCAMIADKANYYINVNKLNSTDAITKAINLINLKYNYSNHNNF